MTTLAQMKCTVCRDDEQPLTEDALAELIPQVHEWRVVERDAIQRLQRRFKFRNFAQALAFTNKVGELAEAEDHHPAILTEWGSVTVTWWTHRIKGLHLNDVVMAAKTDQLLSSD
jgi:4a-hydroxytetrahydrobiopterin dehydratase